MAKDIRVLLVKLADRLHNMRTLDAMTPETQERIARETLDIYAPLANRLGIQWIKNELEELSFRYLKPTSTARPRRQGGHRGPGEGALRHRGGADPPRQAGGGPTRRRRQRPRQAPLLHLAEDAAADIEFEQVQDVVGFRVIVDSVAQCYETLGVVHSQWTPIPGRFKDYIALPKPNLYQSLHTTVVGPASERIEVQIRTREMHRVAEEGSPRTGTTRRRGRREGPGALPQGRRQVRLAAPADGVPEGAGRIRASSSRPSRSTCSRTRSSSSRPRARCKNLPRGATPVDFAYTIHSQVGEHCVGAQVNGQLVPLRTTTS